MSDKINAADIIAAQNPLNLQRKYVKREQQFNFNNQNFDNVKGIFVTMIAKANKQLGAHGKPMFTGSVVMSYHSLETDDEFEARKAVDEKEVRRQLFEVLKQEFEPEKVLQPGCEDCGTVEDINRVQNPYTYNVDPTDKVWLCKNCETIRESEATNDK